MTIICGGPPGSGRDDFLKEVATLAKKKRLTLYPHHVFNYMISAGRNRGIEVTKQTILNLESNLLYQIRDEAYNKIHRSIKKQKGIHVISTPIRFDWKGQVISGLEPTHVQQLKPEFLVVIIDDVAAMQQLLKDDEQWKKENLTLETLSRWRQAEIDTARQYAKMLKRKSYIIARDQNPTVLFDMIFNGNKKKAYFSFPITSASPQQKKEAQKFSEKLEKYLIVLNPLTIYDNELARIWKERSDKGKRIPSKIKMKVNYRRRGEKTFILDSNQVKSAIQGVRNQIVTRDFALIDTCNVVVVYHKISQISAGVISEMVYGHFHAKRVYAFYPYEPSPFFEYNTTEMFTDETKFFKFLRSL